MTPRVVFARSIGALAALVLLASCAGSGRVSPAPASGDAGQGADAVDPAVAVETAQAYAAKHPKDADALFQVGLAWQRRAESTAEAATGKAYLDSARVAYEQVLEVDPSNPKALVHAGLVLEDLGRPDDALASYQKAVEAAPDDPRPYVNLGSLLYFHFKRVYDAKVALMKAVEIDPDNADARFNLGVMFADATLYREARAEWERVAAGPDGPAKALAQQNLEKIRPLLAAQDSAAAAPAAPMPEAAPAAEAAVVPGGGAAPDSAR